MAENLLEKVIEIDKAGQLSGPGRGSLLFGPADRFLRLIRDELAVAVTARDAKVIVSGPEDNVRRAVAAVERIRQLTEQSGPLSSEEVLALIHTVVAESAPATAEFDGIEVYIRGAVVRPKTAGQQHYVRQIWKHDLVFCIGPAGTGKTYLAVAVAVNLLLEGRIKRLVLVRPAVEAGEKLGFLPGDLQAKVNPYLRPLFDALHDMMTYDQIRRFMNNDIIEVIPLAFMRGRTLNESAIIMDEAQNTTPGQMLMFLTRLGQHSKMIVTGDVSQVDLSGQPSGLVDAERKLHGIRGIAFVLMSRKDIVRHSLVQNVVDAYGKIGQNGTADERG